MLSEVLLGLRIDNNVLNTESLGCLGYILDLLSDICVGVFLYTHQTHTLTDTHTCSCTEFSALNQVGLCDL